MPLRDEVKEIRGRQILSSRGIPTVEVEFVTSTAVHRASVPSGASMGSKEAVVLRDEADASYRGRSVMAVLEKLETIRARLLALQIETQEQFDEELIRLDGTENKSGLGANLTTPLSACYCKLAAAIHCRPLWAHIAEIFSATPRMPTPCFNVLNGGLHSGNGMWCQEVMIGFKDAPFSVALERASLLYEALRERISERYGSVYTSVGDEGGFAPPISRIEDGIDMLIEAADVSGVGQFFIALDSAANSFYNGKKYLISGKELTGRELSDYYGTILERYPMVRSMEDPFGEDDIESWKYFYQQHRGRVSVVADDLTVTSAKLIGRYSDRENPLFNTVLIKPNQIGTITETLQAVREAARHGHSITVSHRSGETEDVFIADFAVGIGARHVKFGAPCRGERVAKYNELLRIEEDLGQSKRT